MVLFIALAMAKAFAVPIAETAVVLYVLLRLVPTVGGLLGVANALDNFLPSYEQLMALRRRAEAFEQPTGTRPFTGFHDIVLERVSFAHPDRAPTLIEVSAHIPRGAMIAIVGESGAGKSTLIDLLMGFHTPSGGRITIDGVPLNAFDIQSYRRRIGYVPQESSLFNRTIRDNLRWAQAGATDQQIEAACRQANAEEFIRRLPEGYETIVGDRGVRLSGGQVQRLALARAILRKPDLLILDEATSALDTASERLIQQAIEQIAKETTVVVIAHRLSTIVRANHIYILKDGRVVEDGTYTQLIQQDGAFSRMAHLQVLEALKEA